jgi:tRNA dimethylallyltransferase
MQKMSFNESPMASSPIKQHTVIVIAGPTAVGKTALAIQLAQHFNTEIISADSRQCYKELGIAVAKPSAEQLQQVQHYFINSHSIHEEVNAGSFEQYALATANTIFQQHKVAIMVGGTGLYLKAFCEGIDAMPVVDASIRHAITQAFESNGIAWLQAQVQEKDQAFWQDTHEKENPHRLMRALEMVMATGQSITSFKQHVKIDRPFHIIKIGLALPKEQLHQNIHTRVDQMVEQGLVSEAEDLLPYKHLNALQTVGYRELFDYFNGDISQHQAIEKIKINTRQYAKRQMTWFKKDGANHWFEPHQLKEIVAFCNSKL